MSAVSPVVDRSVPTFRMPRAVYQNGSLLTLSRDALRLYITITYKCHRANYPEVKFKLRELFRQLEMGRNDVHKAAKELRAAHLLHFQQDAHEMNFQLQSEDGAKATSYLRPHPAPVVPAVLRDI